jgi:hypothetical protein
VFIGSGLGPEGPPRNDSSFSVACWLDSPAIDGGSNNGNSRHDFDPLRIARTASAVDDAVVA